MEFEELLRCAEDIEYFANTYIKVEHPVDGLIDLKLNADQLNMICGFRENSVFYSSYRRQVGKSVAAAVILLHESIFHPHRVSVIGARTRGESSRIIRLVEEMHGRLPLFMQVELEVNNVHELKFVNGSRILSIGNNSDWVRSLSFDNLYIDESDYVDGLLGFLEELCMFRRPSRVFMFSSSFTDGVLSYLDR